MKAHYYVYVLTISETGRNDLKDQPRLFNQIQKEFNEKHKIREYLIKRYGKVPRGRKKIYLDVDGKSIPVGFLHSFLESRYFSYE